MRTLTLLLTAMLAKCAFAATPSIDLSEGSTREQKIAALVLLKNAVPEFSSFCDSFPSAEIRVDQFDKKVPNLSIVLQCSIANKYFPVLIYSVAFKPKFEAIDRIIDENLCVNRRAEL